MRLGLGLLPLVLALSTASPGQAADGFWTRESPDKLRSDLVLPEAFLNQVKAKIGHTGKPLGYSYEQMLGFPPFEHRLRTVENLFRDVMAPAEFGGLMGDNLIAKASEPAQISYLLWSQLDARAGREWTVPKTKGDWGVPWLPKGAGSGEALRLALDQGLSARVRRSWTLPEPVERLAARLVIGAQLAAPFLRSAFPPQLSVTRKAAYDLAVSPYLGDVNDDTIAIVNRAAYDMARTWDRNYSAYGAALFLRHFEAAMAEFRASGPTSTYPAFAPIKLQTALGDVVLAGSGKDSFVGPAMLTIDLGGDDTYTGLIGSPSSLANPVSAVVDLGGNDTYDGRNTDGNLGCGFRGVGLINDLAGNDKYLVKNGGIGFGLYGTGMTLDEAGNDLYDCGKGWGQGAAYAGVGLVIDHAGDDKYRSICMSMGFGGTLGVGTLVDLKGNDDYFTADTGNDSKAWGKTVSMSMGCGYGRRCDSGDGQSQGGGFGILVDADGNDNYHTSVFSLGSGYWWGAGIFEDRAGDDTYRATHYCMGSGAHFAVGSFVDLKGNDRYNDRPDAVERWGGLGRDGSIAVCIDGEGDDVWGNLTGGHSDLNSYSLFWDRSGNDVYKRMQPFDPAMVGNRPFGSSSPYPPMRNFRDRLPSAGIFLDTGGKDVYPNGMTAAEGTEWMLYKGPLNWGYGVDTQI